jgi:type VI secretion system secreted protein Hcp
MAIDIFLKIDGIKGESQDSKHKGEIDILSWSWGVSQSGTTPTGAGGGAGQAHVNDITLTKHVDKSTPPILQHILNGGHIKSADMYIRKAGGSPLEYLKIHFEDVAVSSYATGGSSGQDRVTENVALKFSRFKMDYTPQKADGTGDAAITIGWDVKGNKPIG